MSAPIAVATPVGVPIADSTSWYPSETTVASETPRSKPTDEAASALKRLDGMMCSGLCTSVVRAVESHPLRVVILDNSGSMRAHDGKRSAPMPGGKGYRTVTCTRWEELAADVSSLCKWSEACGARTDLHLLNPTTQFRGVSLNSSSWSSISPLGRSVDPKTASSLLDAVSPNGTTPLTQAVMQVVTMVQPHATRLHADGQAVAVLLCTDGMPDDQRTFIESMKMLQKLPVWVVVRLCTDDDSVVEFWNDLDRSLEAPLEVLDDVRGEADEVAKLNPWLTYAPPLHMARLFGLPEKLFDALDEAPLVPSQIKRFISIMFGLSDLPEPELELEAFLSAVRAALQEQPNTYDPRSGRMKPWVDMHALERAVRYPGKCGQGGCAIM